MVTLFKKNQKISTMYDFHNSTDTLKFWTEKWVINKTFFCFSFDFGETWWNCSTHGYKFTKFHQNQMKNKKVLVTACFSVQNFKVSVELWKSYIVHTHKRRACNKDKYNFLTMFAPITNNFLWNYFIIDWVLSSIDSIVLSYFRTRKKSSRTFCSKNFYVSRSI